MLSVAIEDLTATAVQGAAPPQTDLDSFLMRPENYSFEITLMDQTAIVIARPEPYKGESLEGGARKYQVSLKDFSITSREIWK